jgi:EAL domain-containing protein (putative c-di-GMP-specific phosphodiesterase class I)
MIQDPENSIAKMKTLRARGMTFSIDDFGTGYSSLSYLNLFPIDSIKIDRSFITDTLEKKGDQEIVKTIIAMAHSLNIDAIAEGVETKAQKDFLIHHGCSNLQGFLFAIPLPVEEFKDFLQHHKDAVENEKALFASKAQCR